MMDPLRGSAWSTPATVTGFAASAPNRTLMRLAALERERGGRLALDIGCGAGRNALPLASIGWDVVGTDLSWPMLEAARTRVTAERPSGRLVLALAPMEQLPIRDCSTDLIVAHGIWNLARSAEQFRRAIREAARVSARGAALFVFTFSRTTLAPSVEPVAGEPFVFTEFSGEPQCFLTEAQLVAELADAGFHADPASPLTELNRPPRGALRAGGPPVIYEGLFRHAG
jgi:SAM-dependent methyltransferase